MSNTDHDQATPANTTEAREQTETALDVEAIAKRVAFYLKESSSSGQGSSKDGRGVLPDNIEVLADGGPSGITEASKSLSAGQAALEAALSSLTKVQGPEVALGRGIPPMPKKLVEKMLAWSFIDLSELPPARVRSKDTLVTAPNVLLVQSAESLKTQRRLIPDIMTWVQCFSIYVSVMATRHPEQVPELLAYMQEIIRASRQFRWPSWVVYDTNYRRQMAETQSKDWSKVEPSIYSRCFTGWAKSSSWCETCLTLDHDSADCPFSSGTNGMASNSRRERKWQPYPNNAQSYMQRGKVPLNSKDICLKYNRYDGDCHYGTQCRFKHACALCGGPHPKGKCAPRNGAGRLAENSAEKK